MAHPLPKPVHAADFLEWESPDGRRYELRDGEVVAMAPTKAAHQILAARLARFLDEALDERPSCTVRVEAPIVVAERDEVHHADLAVSCREHQVGETAASEPVVIVEVLSPSTETYDRRVKLGDYRRIASVQEIVYVAQDQHYCEVYRRLPDDRWQVDLLQTGDAVLRLASIGFEQPLHVLYEKVNVGSA